MSTLPPYDPTAPLLPGVTLLEASAGTGKTYSIADLVVRFVAEIGVPIHQLLVVTFTIAATAELKDRVRKRLGVALQALADGSTATPDAVLDHLLQGASDAAERTLRMQRLRAALEGFDEAAISTIHGFCQRMLKQNAFESGAGFDVDMLKDCTPLLEEIVDDFISSKLSTRKQATILELRESGFKREFLLELARALEAEPHIHVLPDPGLHQNGKPISTDPSWAMQFRLGFVRYLRAELTDRKQRRRVQTYTDLLSGLYNGLKNPERAPALRNAIRSRYRVALIDEFQDTDQVQWGIFEPVFGTRQVGEDPTWLFLIGDPKQAIYSFRGADIHTYLDAARTAGDRRFTLGTNWRSDGRLVRAFNTLLDVPQVMAEADIPYVRVDTPAKHHDDRLHFQHGPEAPLELVFLERERSGKLTRSNHITAGAFRTALLKQVTTDVVELLNSGATLDTAEGTRPLEPRDIAILVRANSAAAALQRSLQAVGVPSVRAGGGSVWHSSDADMLQRVLDALAEPGREQLVRAALATPVFGYDAQAIHNLSDTDWSTLYDQLAHWKHLWQHEGFMPMFRRLTTDRDLAATLLERTDGERRLTNVLHLAELLHKQAGARQLGPAALIAWMRTQRLHIADDADASELRLESDADAVRLVTIHGSKGLQYPVVFCPYLWAGNLLKYDRLAKRMLRFHHQDHGLSLHLSSQDRPGLDFIRDQEHDMQAENLRLLYVALTRAEHRCVTYWGAVNNGWHSAIASVLHARDGQGDPRDIAPPRVKAMADGTMLAELERIAAASTDAQGQPTIAVRRAELRASPTYKPPKQAEQQLIAWSFGERDLDRNWRRGSFSALVRRDGPYDGSPTAEGVDHDAEQGAGVELPALPDSPAVPLADFPRGAEPGTFLHAVLEHVDFTAGDDPLRQVVVEQVARFGFDLEGPELDQALLGLRAALHTPMGGAAADTMLAHIPRFDRLDELDFTFPVAGGYQATEAAVTPASIADVLRQHPDLPAPWLDELARLGARPLRGFLTGSIDLVFRRRVQGHTKWFLADYKSNWLGDGTGHTAAHHYNRAALTQAMRHHHYFLQYLLYTVALHRYLGARLGTDWDYERDYGGAYYLFLRGMTGPKAPRQPDGCAYGVFHDRPPLAVINALSDHLRQGQP